MNLMKKNYPLDFNYRLSIYLYKFKLIKITFKVTSEQSLVFVKPFYHYLQFIEFKVKYEVVFPFLP